MRVYLFTLCLLILLLLPAPLYAQEPVAARPTEESQAGGWRTFGQEDGLGDDQVLSVWGDGQGAIWAGTQRGGLSCFDEETWEWTTFTTGDGLPSNSVNAVWGIPAAEGSKRRVLWVGTDLGLGRALFAGCDLLPGEKWSTITTDDGLGGNDVQAVWGGSSGDGGELWVGTESGGVSRFVFSGDGSQDGNWTTYGTKDGSLKSDSVRGTWGDGQGVVWFATDAGLSRWDGSAWRTFTKTNGLASDQIQAVWGDRSGTVWAGTAGGVSYGNEQGWRTFTSKDGLISDDVQAVWGDDQGVVWLGMSPNVLAGAWRGGVSRWDGGEWQNFGVADASTGTGGLGGSDVSAIWGDGRGTIWVGTLPLRSYNEGGGLSRYEEGQCSSFVSPDGLGAEDVQAVWDDLQGVLWVGTRGGGVSRLAYSEGEDEWTLFTTEDGLGANEVWAIWALGKTAWVGTSGGLSRYEGDTFRRWTTFTEEDGLGSNFVRAVWVDSQGVVWAGTVPNPDTGASGGLSRWDGREWTTFTTAAGLPLNEVLAVTGCPSGERSAQDTIWVGTRDRGLARWDGASWATFASADGLASDYISSIWCEPASPAGVWVGTTGGLSRWDGASWRTFTTADGLPADDVWGVWGDDAGGGWAATGKGLGRWDGSRWETITGDDGLISDEVRAVSVGQGRVWAGTSGGLSLFETAASSARLLKTYTLASDRVANDVRAIWADEDGELWLGTAQGLSHYTPSSGAGGWYSLGRDREVHALWVTQPPEPDGVKTLWAGTSSGLFRWDNVEGQGYVGLPEQVGGLADRRVRALWGQGEDVLWVGTDGGVSCYRPSFDTWQSFSTTDGLAANDVQALWGREITGTQQVEIWAGTIGGLSRLTVEEGTCAPLGSGQRAWETFTKADGLSDNWINTVWIDERGTVWAGTRNGGVSYLPSDRGSGATLKQGKWMSFGVADGLGANDVLSLWEDRRGSLWAGTEDGGVSRLDVGEYVGGLEQREEDRPWRWRRTWTTFKRANSCLGSNVVQAIRGTPDGEVLVGTDAWYNRYEPTPPGVTSLVVWTEDKLLPCSSEIKIDPGALDFFVVVDDPDSPPNEIAYRYKLEKAGEHQPWRFLENAGDEKQRLISTRASDPGHYVFSVAAGNIHFDWSEPVTCSFTVRDLLPPQVEIRKVQISDQAQEDVTPREVSVTPLLLAGPQILTDTIPMLLKGQRSLKDVTSLMLEGQRTLTYSVMITDLNSYQGLVAYYRLQGVDETQEGTFDPARPLILKLIPNDYELAIWAKDGAGIEEREEQQPDRYAGPIREDNESAAYRSSITVPKPQYIDLLRIYVIVSAIVALPIAIASVYVYRRTRLRRSHRYNDLEVQLSPGGEAGTQTVKLLSPGRQPLSAALPFDQSMIQGTIEGLGRGVSDELALRYLGERLFNALFGDDSRSYLVGQIPSRLRLNFRDLPQLAALPWEYLYDGKKLGFLGVSPDTALVRFLPPEGRARDLRAVLPLKLLVVIASPRDHAQWGLEPIDAEGEKRRLDEALASLVSAGKLQAPVYLEGRQATSDQVRSYLQRGFDIVHFVCHGGVSEGRGLLVLVDENGDYLPISQEELAALFAGFASEGVRTPKLVVLNACRTAGQVGGEELAGLAPELVVKGGLPAVVGMQYPIRDESAKTFAAAFYAALAEAGQVDYAISVGRKAIAVELDLDSRDWGCPVLYVQVKDGIIFEVV